MQALNIVLWKPLDLEFIQLITKNCGKLTELAVIGSDYYNKWCDSSFMEKDQDSVKFLVENLTTNIQKLSFSNLKSVKNELVEILVKRCVKLTELNLNGTKVDNRLISSICQNLGNLEKLDVTDTDIGIYRYRDTDIGSAKLHELQSLTKLKVLNSLNLTKGEKKSLKKQLPQVCLNQEELKIATSWQKFKRENGFWEIHAVQVQTFKDRTSGWS